MSEIADAVQIIRVTLEGMEIAIRVGSGSMKTMRNVVKFLHGMLAYEKQMGKTTMKKLLMRGGDLQVLQFKKDDLKKVQKLAKKYGILYSTLPDMGQGTDKVEVLFHSEAVPRINLLIQKLNSNSIKLRSMDSFLEEKDGKELEVFDKYIQSQKKGNLDSHTDKAFSNLLEKVGKYAVERSSVSVDEVRVALAEEQEKVQKVFEDLKVLGVVGEPDATGQYKVTMDKESFESKIRRFQELKERMHMIALSKDTNLSDITIAKKLIVEENDHAIKTRIPFTVGDNARYVWFKKEDVMEINRGKTILTYIDVSKDYKIYSKDNRVIDTVRGEELYKRNYSPVDRAVRENHMKNLALEKTPVLVGKTR